MSSSLQFKALHSLSKVLVSVFSYILIQSREFDDPVVVKGMVYLSEKKRVTLKWVILSAIVLYILGAVILL